MPRSDRSGADGVVAHTYLLCEPPPRPLNQRWLRDIFLDVAAPPPHEEGNMLRHAVGSHLSTTDMCSCIAWRSLLSSGWLIRYGPEIACADSSALKRKY